MTAALAGILGWPVGHSLSPRLHGHWFAAHGLQGAYVALPVRPEDLALAFQALPKLGFRGWNVTIPHKEAAFALCPAHDDAAAAMGAVNTVLVLGDGSLRGCNTDGLGFMAGLGEAAPAWTPAAGPGVLLGTGGAARAVAVALAQAGVQELRLVNRTPGRAEALAAELAALAPACRSLAVPWEARAQALEGAALLVQSTSLGMAGQPPLELDLAALPVAAVVAELVYRPLVTPLLAAAAARGHPTMDGLAMLLHQAVPGFACWGGVRPAVDAATRAVLAAAL